MSSELTAHWTLDPDVAYLNHGSYGACPGPVLEAQSRLRAELEREPVQFMHGLEPRLDAARAALAAFVGARAEDLAFVPNATQGVNAVLRSLTLSRGDELLTTNHAYNACRQAMEYVAGRSGAKVVVATPETILDAATERTRLALVDHITSPTGIILPIAEIVRGLAAKGIDTLVDGAHAPGQLDLNIPAIGAAYYAGNCHKWLCAPKGAGLLWVRRERQTGIHPVAISHGYNAKRDRSRFLLEFDWTGTADPTPYLCIPEAIRFMGSLLPGGWQELRASNHAKVVAGRRILCEALDVPPPYPESMLGSLASVPLPDGPESLEQTLYRRHRIEVPVHPWPAPPKRLIRISAQLYNRLEQYGALAAALKKEL